MKKQDLKSFVIHILRRGSYKWSARSEALRLARVERNAYMCRDCGPWKLYQRKDVEIDHKIPVVPITGFDTWDGYVSRLFCDVSGFQILCKPCHQKKTDAEGGERKKYKKKKVNTKRKKK